MPCKTYISLARIFQVIYQEGYSRHRQKLKEQEEPGRSRQDGRRGSCSDEDIIECFPDESGILRLEEQMKLHHLEMLMEHFKNHRPTATLINDSPYSAPRYQLRQPGLLTLQEFKDAIAKVLNTHEYDDQLETLFTKLDTGCDGYVDWNEFCTYMLLQYRENDYMRTKKLIPFRQEARIRHIVFNRQETTTKVIAVDNPVKYVTVSKEGAICVWDTLLHLERHYSLTDGEEDSRGVKRRFKTWVTDAVYMPNIHRIAISSSSRDIRLYDVTSSSQYYEEFHLYSLPDVPQCLAYWYDPKNPGGESYLMYGDDRGGINVLTFIRPTVQLFATPYKAEEGVQKIYFQDLYTHSKFITYTNYPGIHEDTVRKICYMSENHCVMSSCGAPRGSVVILDLFRKKKNYIFNISKGVETFDYSKNLNLLVTGSIDHAVRLWNVYVTSKPVAVLHGHAVGIVEVRIHEKLGQVFTYSRDAVLKVWDIREQVCLQTVTVKFPISLHGKMPEHGPFAFHLQPPPQNALIITSNDYIAMLKLGQQGPPVSLTPITHQTQLCAAIYNPFFKQVVTGADDSSIAVWELESGAKNMMFTNTHGQEEITCLRFDDSWRRLITGARNGTVKVWNVQNGHNLHRLEAVDDAEVTAVIPLPERKQLLAVGWSRQITLYDDSHPDNMYIKMDTSWKDGHTHQEDILAADTCPPNLLATASFDGEICIWSLETEKLLMRLRKGQVVKIDSQKLPYLTNVGESRPSTSGRNSRPNSRHRSSHRVARGQPAPVDKLLFLQGRAKVKRNHGAILISSEGGTLHWWSIYNNKHELGCFYVPDNKDESVLAMCSDPTNTQLITGDTNGMIAVWDISQYCIAPNEKKDRTQPPQLYQWHAHDAAVVSVEYVEHEHGVYLLSASTDKTARLWTLEGYYIGIFGQKKRWNLQNTQTWVKPPPEPEPDDPVEELQTDGTKSPSTLKREEEMEDEEAGTGGRPDTKVDTFSPSKLQASPTSKSANSSLLNGDTEGPMRTWFKQRAHTFMQGNPGKVERLSRGKSNLGYKVDEDFERMKLDRNARRNHFSDVTLPKPQKVGKLCCPYQALTTPNIDDFQLPDDLPVSQRMVSKGYSDGNLNLDTLGTMDLSYNLDTPPSGEQLAQSNKKSPKLPSILKPRKSYSSLPSSFRRSKTTLSAFS